MRGRMRVNMEKCLKVYYQNQEIGNADIREMFNVSGSKASLMKTEVMKKQAEKGIRFFNSCLINTDFAFEYWGLNVADMERRITKLRKLGFSSREEEKANEQ